MDFAAKLISYITLLKFFFSIQQFCHSFSFLVVWFEVLSEETFFFIVFILPFDRSLPDLELVGESSLMSILRWNFKTSMTKTISSSDTGHIVLVRVLFLFVKIICYYIFPFYYFAYTHVCMQKRSLPSPQGLVEVGVSVAWTLSNPKGASYPVHEASVYNRVLYLYLIPLVISVCMCTLLLCYDSSSIS